MLSLRSAAIRPGRLFNGGVQPQIYCKHIYAAQTCRLSTSSPPPPPLSPPIRPSPLTVSPNSMTASTHSNDNPTIPASASPRLPPIIRRLYKTLLRTGQTFDRSAVLKAALVHPAEQRIEERLDELKKQHQRLCYSELGRLTTKTPEGIARAKLLRKLQSSFRTGEPADVSVLGSVPGHSDPFFEKAHLHATKEMKLPEYLPHLSEEEYFRAPDRRLKFEYALWCKARQEFFESALGKKATLTNKLYWKWIDRFFRRPELGILVNGQTLPQLLESAKTDSSSSRSLTILKYLNITSFSLSPQDPPRTYTPELYLPTKSLAAHIRKEFRSLTRTPTTKQYEALTQALFDILKYLNNEKIEFPHEHFDQTNSDDIWMNRHLKDKLPSDLLNNDPATIFHPVKRDSHTAPSTTDELLEQWEVDLDAILRDDSAKTRLSSNTTTPPNPTTHSPPNSLNAHSVSHPPISPPVGWNLKPTRHLRPGSILISHPHVRNNEHVHVCVLLTKVDLEKDRIEGVTLNQPWNMEEHAPGSARVDKEESIFSELPRSLENSLTKLLGTSLGETKLFSLKSGLFEKTNENDYKKVVTLTTQLPGILNDGGIVDEDDQVDTNLLVLHRRKDWAELERIKRFGAKDAATMANIPLPTLIPPVTETVTINGEQITREIVPPVYIGNSTHFSEMFDWLGKTKEIGSEQWLKEGQTLFGIPDQESDPKNPTPSTPSSTPSPSDSTAKSSIPTLSSQLAQKDDLAFLQSQLSSFDLVVYHGRVTWELSELLESLFTGEWLLFEGNGTHIFTAPVEPRQLRVRQTALKKFLADGPIEIPKSVDAVDSNGLMPIEYLSTPTQTIQDAYDHTKATPLPTPATHAAADPVVSPTAAPSHLLPLFPQLCLWRHGMFQLGGDGRTWSYLPKVGLDANAQEDEDDDDEDDDDEDDDDDDEGDDEVDDSQEDEDEDNDDDDDDDDDDDHPPPHRG